MKTRSLSLIGTTLLATCMLVSCSHARTDLEITTDVQAKIHQQAALAAAPINIQANSGVVVLSGNVASDDARNAAESAAKQVKGVKGVINNLQVVTASAVPVPAPSVAEAPMPKPRPGAAKGPKAARTSAASVPEAPAPVAAAPAVQPQPAAPPAQASAPVPTQPAVSHVVIPQGTRLTVRLIDPVDTEKHKEGASFRASLDAPVVIQNKTVIPKNANATARLISSKSAGRFTGTSEVVLVLATITVGGKSYELQTGQFTKQTASRGERSAKVIGGGALAGAVIGAIAGGGKGAAIGAAAGAGAGTGVQAVTKGPQIKLPSETLLEFQLTAPVTVTPASDAAEPETAG